MDFVLLPGDLVLGNIDQTSLEAELLIWRDVMQPVYDANIAVYPVRGNHDIGTGDQISAWNNVFSGDYLLPQNGPAGELNLTYSVNHKNVLVLALDEYVTSHRVNQTWVNQQFADNTQPHIIAFGHEPAFQVNSTNCLDDQPTNRNTFWQSLIDAGCRIYACGHDHFYDHALVDNNDADSTNDVHQYIVGTAGAPLHSWSPPYTGDNGIYTPIQYHHSMKYGYILVDVTDQEMTMTWYERNAATGEYEMPIGTVDFDSSFAIDYNDLNELVKRWLDVDCIIGNNFCDGKDLDQSTIVDMFDYTYLADQWQDKFPFVLTVASSSDDAEEEGPTGTSPGTVYLTSSDLELTDNENSSTPRGLQVIGIRFNNVTLEKGAQLANAYIQFTVDETNNDNPCNLTIYAEDTSNAATFTSDSYNISNRPKTTAFVSWAPPDWTTIGDAGIEQQTPVLTAIIEEVVSRPDWTKGNSIVFIIEGTGRRTAESFDKTAPAQLHILMP